jgi:MFS family permease
MYQRRKRGGVTTNMSEQQQRQEDGFRDEDKDEDLNHPQALAMDGNAIDTMDIPEPLGSDNKSSKDWKAQVAAGFTSLKNSPSELYKVYALKFLDSYSYFSFSIIFTLFLSDDFGYSDIEAGTIYGAWGAMITVYGFCTGFLVDNFGVSKSLKLGYALSLLARCGIFLTTSRTMLLFHLYGTLPLGNCLGIPVLMTGIRRYTHEKNRGFAFGIFYVVMNIAALVSGPVVDVLTIWYKGDSENDAENGGEGATKGWSLSSYRAIILSGILSNAIACCISFTVREIKVDAPTTVVVNDKGYDDHPETNGHSRSVIERGDGGGEQQQQERPPASTGGVTVFRPKTGSPRQILGEIWISPSFRRYLLVIMIMLNVRQIFRHLDATWPKYMIRGTYTSLEEYWSTNKRAINVLFQYVIMHPGSLALLLLLFFCRIWS